MHAKVSAVTQKVCFLIAPLGEPGSAVRQRSDALLERVIIPAVQPLGYTVVRADRIATPGMLPMQIAAHLIKADLAIADLTGANFNVGYELGVRDTLGKPCIHVIAAGEHLPFDVASMRTIMVDTTTDAATRTAIATLQSQIRSSGIVITPVSALVEVRTTVRDAAMFETAASIGDASSAQPSAPVREVPTQPAYYKEEEHALFWQSLEYLPQNPDVAAVLRTTVESILANPRRGSKAADGAYAVKTRQVIMDGRVLPALRVAYTITGNTVCLLHVREVDLLDDPDGAQN